MKNKQEFIKAAKKIDLHISDYANDMLDKVQFEKPAKFDYVIKKVSDLGFTRWTRYDEILKKAKEEGFDLLTHSEALQIALTQKVELGHWIVLNTEPIAGRDGDPYVFSLGRYGGGLWLGSRWARPGGEWDPDDEFVFRLRKPLETKKLKKETLGDLDSLTLASDLPDTLIINNVKYVRAK